MERGGAGGWHGAGAGRGFGSGSRSGYPGEEEECFGGREYRWAGRGFDLGYGDAGLGGRARGCPRRGFQPRGSHGGGAMRGGLARRPSRGGTSRGRALSVLEEARQAGQHLHSSRLILRKQGRFQERLIYPMWQRRCVETLLNSMVLKL
jgi:hypothetical protein